MSDEYKNEALDWNDTVKKGSEYTLIPEGVYDFTIEGFERSRYEGSDKVPPCYRALLKIRIDAPEGTTVINESLLLYRKMEWKLAEFFCLSVLWRQVKGMCR